MLEKTEGKRRGQQKMRWLDINRHEFEQTPGDSEGLGSLTWCSPWLHKESDEAEQQFILEEYQNFPPHSTIVSNFKRLKSMYFSN